MTKYSYRIANSNYPTGMIVDRFEAAVAYVDLEGKNNKDIPDYIEIEIEDESALFRTNKKGSYKDAIWVSPKALKSDYKDQVAVINEVTKNDFLLFKHKHDEALRIAYIGFWLTITGILINTPIAIGRYTEAVLIPTSNLVLSI